MFGVLVVLAFESTIDRQRPIFCVSAFVSRGVKRALYTMNTKNKEGSKGH